MTRHQLAAGERPPWYRVGPVMALVEAPAPPAEGAPAAAPPSTTADVYVFDTIGGWFGMTADDFVRDVASLEVDQIVLHLNTPGGDATEGVAIANVLRAHKARVVVRVDGMAASAGSVIAMAGDEIVMGIGSQLMVHDAWSYAVGDAAALAAAGRMLDSTSNSLAATYAARAGGTAASWRAVMQAETWYTADEAVAAGLADRVAAADEVGTAEGPQITPGAGSYLDFWGMWDSLADPGRFDLSAFRYAGRAAAPAPGTARPPVAPKALGVSFDVGDRVQVTIDPPHMAGQTTGTVAELGTTAIGVVFDAMPEMGVHRWYVADELAPAAQAAPGMSARRKTPAASAAGRSTTERTGIVPFLDDVRQRLGVAADADETTTLTALDEVLEESAPAAAVLPDGVVAVEAAALAQLRADAQLGRDAHDRQARDDRAALVEAAVADGRIAPARRAAWVAQLEADPGAAETLASLERGLIPVGAPIGHAGGDDSVADDLYASVFGKES